MYCHNHPNAPAIAICQRCTAEMCGPCTRFLDAREYCEKCAETILAESFVAARTKQLERRKEAQAKGKQRQRKTANPKPAVSRSPSSSRPSRRAEPVPVPAAESSTLAALANTTSRRRAREQTVLWLGFGGSSAMILFALMVYAFPMLFQIDRAVAAEWEAYQALEDCRLIFEEIGFLLENGQMPDQDVRCADTLAPNIVEKVGDGIRISHPAPSTYGLRELYVSSQSHEVVFVEARAL